MGAGASGVLLASLVGGGPGTAVLLTASLAPSLLLAARHRKATRALRTESRHRHRLEGELSVAEHELRRLADRVAHLTEAAGRARVQAERDAEARAVDAARRALARAEVAPDLGSRPARIRGQRSFASIDLRVFDALAQADAQRDERDLAMLEEPVHRGRHVARPAPVTGTGPQVRGVTRRGPRTLPHRSGVRDVA